MYLAVCLSVCVCTCTICTKRQTLAYTACGSDILMTSSESTTGDDNVEERLGVFRAGHRKKYRQTYMYIHV